MSRSDRAVEVGALTINDIDVEWVDSPTPFQRAGAATVQISTRLDRIGLAVAVASILRVWLQAGS